MNKLSIVIPMFNSFGLMKKALAHFEGLTSNEVEIIIVDDCSTDGSYEQAVQYARYSQLNVIVLKNEKNVGPGASRNHGIEIASGDYITFVDSDDYLDPRFYDKVNSLMEQGVDCVIFDYALVSESGEKISSGSSIGTGNVRQGLLDLKKAFVYTYGSTWGKLYKKSVIDTHNIRFGEFFRNEDMPFTKLAIAKCSSIYYLQEELYNYVQVGTSLMHNSALSDEMNCQRAFRMLSDCLAGEGMDEELLAVELREVLNNSVLIKTEKRCTSAEITSYIKENYRKEHIHSSYFQGYPFHVKIVSWFAYYRCIFILRILEGIRKWKTSRT